jgi:hypothetical protein
MPEQNEIENTETNTEVNEKQETNQVDDLKTLFTEDDIKAKKETIAKTKADEDRRAKLSEDERKAEDKVKAEEADKKAKEAAKGIVPEKYDEFKVPDGMELDKEMMNEATPLFKEIGLTQEKAQKIADLYGTKIVPMMLKRWQDSMEDTKAAWHAETIANKDIKLDAEGKNLDAIRVINSLFPKDKADSLRADFVKLGMDQHPGLNSLLAKMAVHLKEDTIELGKDKGGKEQANTVESYAAALYGKK